MNYSDDTVSSYSPAPVAQLGRDLWLVIAFNGSLKLACHSEHCLVTIRLIRSSIVGLESSRSRRCEREGKPSC